MYLKKYRRFIVAIIVTFFYISSFANLIDAVGDINTCVVAHRGDWRSTPENSLQAIKNCIVMGIDMVEIDIRMTKDGKLVLMHDETLNRTTTGSGNVSDFTLAELEKLYLKNGAGHKTRHKIPTLEQALSVAKDKIFINIDKGYDYFNEVYSILQATGMSDQVIIKSSHRIDVVNKTYPGLLEKVIFMPVVNINKGDAFEIINEYLDYGNIFAFELNFDSERSYHDDIFKSIRQSGSRIFVNSLWPELCASHDDDIAVESNLPDNSWGWLINKGVQFIQTDLHN